MRAVFVKQLRPRSPKTRSLLISKLKTHGHLIGPLPTRLALLSLATSTLCCATLQAEWLFDPTLPDAQPRDTLSVLYGNAETNYDTSELGINIEIETEISQLTGAWTRNRGNGRQITGFVSMPLDVDIEEFPLDDSSGWIVGAAYKAPLNISLSDGSAYWYAQGYYLNQEYEAVTQRYLDGDVAEKESLEASGLLAAIGAIYSRPVDPRLTVHAMASLHLLKDIDLESRDTSYFADGTVSTVDIESTKMKRSDQIDLTIAASWRPEPRWAMVGSLRLLGGTAIDIGLNYALGTASGQSVLPWTEKAQASSKNSASETHDAAIDTDGATAIETNNAHSVLQTPPTEASPRQLQAALADRGYDVGTIDGKLGKKTKKALQKFQQDNGLAETAEPDQDTLQALGF